MSKAKGHPRCAGTVKNGERAGEQCLKYAVEGSKYCQSHGGNRGKKNRGIAHPRFKNGKTSHYMPVHLIDKVQTLLGDPDLYSMRENIAVLYARLTEIYSELEDDSSFDNWLQVKKFADQFRVANAAKDERRARMAFAEMMDVIDRGASEVRKWEEIRAIMKDIKLLGEAETKRVVSLETMMGASDAVDLATQLGLIVRTHVQDRDTLVKIQRDFLRVMDEKKAMKNARLTEAVQA